MMIKNRLIFNCTEGGVNLKGAANIPFELICEELIKTSPHKIPLVENPLPSKLDNDVVAVVRDKINHVIDVLENIEGVCVDAIDLIHERKLLSKKLLHLIDGKIEIILGVEGEIKYLIGMFNQLDFYNLNQMTVREERRSGGDLLVKYNKFFHATLKSVKLTRIFMLDIKNIYTKINNRVEISFDSIIGIKSIN